MPLGDGHPSEYQGDPCIVADGAEGRRYSRPVRLLILLGGILLSWGLLVGAVLGLMRLFF